MFNKRDAKSSAERVNVAIRQLKRVQQELLYGDDGTGCDYATSCKIGHIVQSLDNIETEIITNAKDEKNV